ncbi:hypothetical protein [Rhizobium favelukesii]|uniref:Metalloprotease protein n=2 Tax=Rhizobium TaxID=379 RepID=W6R6H8_9HYPH|nr:metalloprotease protein [Rhizobium favelukesii]
MRNVGMDPVALVRFFGALEEKLADHSRTSMLSTHPGTPDRKDAILKYRAVRTEITVAAIRLT